MIDKETYLKEVVSDEVIERVASATPINGRWNINFARAILALAATPVAAQPACYVNGDDLDNMLGDRGATIVGKKNGWRKTPLYRHPAVPTRDTHRLGGDESIMLRNLLNG